MVEGRVSLESAGLSVTFPPFQPPWWLRNPHVQTIVAARKPRRWHYGWRSSEAVLVDLGADGTLVGEASWQQGRKPDSPLLILLHGLEGSARSHYLIGMSRKAHCAGFHTVRMNTRNCGGTEHLTPTLYNAGLSQDVRAVILHFRQKLGIEEIYAAGVSLGANMLLKFLGEEGERGRKYLRGAATLSPPVDLAAGVGRMAEPRNWVYQRYFVAKLIGRMRRKIALYPEIGDMARIKRIRTIHEFDDVVTAPHFGFGDADNYYRIASSGPLLKNIRVPTLIVQAKDDPLIPYSSFARFGLEQNPSIHLLATDHGGHTGFFGSTPSGTGDKDGYWGESRVVQFLSTLASLGERLREDRAGHCEP